jgi:SAM-dependent methyltransferase
MTPDAMVAPPIADALTDRVRATWTDGDFGRIAASYQRGAAEFIARLGLGEGETVLDVACGTGNLALPAARAGAAVTGLDIAPNLLDQLARHTAAEGLSIELHEGNCEALPYDDASFDTVVTMFGAIFAARPDQTATELVRVCRPGGRIAMANWTREGFIGQMLKIIVGYVPPPADVPSPLLWGDEPTVAERLAGTTPQFTRRLMSLEFPFSPAATVDYFRTWYGPTKRAFDALDVAARESLHRDLTVFWSEHNRAKDGTTRVESEYLEVVAVRA